MSTSWTQYLKHHGGGTVAASEDWKKLSDDEKAEFRPRTGARSRSRSRSRSRARSRSQKATTVKGDGEINKGLFSPRWVDLSRTMIDNHWPREIVTEMVRVYRKDVKAMGYVIDSRHWEKNVLPFAARDPTVQADWKEIVGVVRTTNIQLPKLTKELVDVIETLRSEATTKTDTSNTAHTPEFNAQIFTVYMIHFSYLLTANLKVKKSMFTGAGVAVGAAAGAVVIGVAELSMDIVIGVGKGALVLLELAGELALLVLKSPFFIFYIFFKLLEN